MNPEEMKRRTKAFALRVILFVRSLPPDDVSRTMGKQFLRAGISVGANYRAVCRARSPIDMIAKLKIVEEEVDESGYWLELFDESGNESRELKLLLAESREILAIVVASIKTLRNRGRDPS